MKGIILLAIFLGACHYTCEREDTVVSEECMASHTETSFTNIIVNGKIGMATTITTVCDKRGPVAHQVCRGMEIGWGWK